MQGPYLALSAAMHTIQVRLQATPTTRKINPQNHTQPLTCSSWTEGPRLATSAALYVIYTPLIHANTHYNPTCSS